MKEHLENFERSFTSGSGYARQLCQCGQEYFDGHNSISWDEGEIEKLRTDPNAIELDYSVGSVVFEGKEYCVDCECWKKRATMLISFILGHRRQIADFLNADKARLIKEAEDAPSVN